MPLRQLSIQNLLNSVHDLMSSNFKILPNTILKFTPIFSGGLITSPGRDVDYSFRSSAEAKERVEQ